MHLSVPTPKKLPMPHDPSHADAPIRATVRDASLTAIDLAHPSLSARDLALLDRFAHERHVRVQLGMEAEAAGLEAAMLIVWHTATTPDVVLAAPTRLMGRSAAAGAAVAG
jgi:hypothetical protein